MSLTIIRSEKSIKTLQDALEGVTYVGFDTETSGLDSIKVKIYTIQLYINYNVYVIDCLALKDISFIYDLLKEKVLVGHNIKFDLKVMLRKLGKLFTNVYDTMLGEVMINQGIGEKFYSLQYLVKKYFDITLDKTVRKEFYEYGELTELTNEQLMYAAEDVIYLTGIMEQQLKQLEEQKQLKVLDLEMKLVPVVATMEDVGLALDAETWTKLMNDALREAELVASMIKDEVIQNLSVMYPTVIEFFNGIFVPITTNKLRDSLQGLKTEFNAPLIKKFINISSPKQVTAILNRLGIPVESSSEKVLKECGVKHEIIDMLLLYRELEKKGTSFGQKFLDHIHPVTGRIHAEFNQLMADTGRFSSSNPNMQQIVRDSAYRDCFHAREGHVIITADYSQQELRLAGAITGEPNFISAYLNGIDLHTLTASILYGVDIKDVTSTQRQIAKGYNFAVLYGSTEYGLAYNFQMDIKVAKQLLNKFYQGYKVLAVFKETIEDAIYAKGYSSTPLGRKRFFSKSTFYADRREMDKECSRIKRQGFNHIIQGAGADVTKLALVEIFYKNPFGDKLKILMPVHDEIVCEVASDIAEEASQFIVKCMKDVEQPFLGNIPAEVGYKIKNTWSK